MNWNNLAKAIALSGWVLSILGCFGLIGSYVYALFMFPDMPGIKDLATMAATAVGFLLAQVPSMVKELVSEGAARKDAVK